jgi:hypothetical protein
MTKTEQSSPLARGNLDRSPGYLLAGYIGHAR